MRMDLDSRSPNFIQFETIAGGHALGVLRGITGKTSFVPIRADNGLMRELSESQEVGPSLFDAPPPESYVQAKDFVRWCCSFGADFRNSPDITNLRYWAQKNNVKIRERG